MVLVLAAACAPAAAQTWVPSPYAGPAIDPQMAMQQQHLWRMEQLQQQSRDQAAYAAQFRANARLTQLELDAQRQPEPYIRRDPLMLRSPEAEAEARAQATERRERVVSGVTQIDDWLARGPR